jgi:hypothetical protein
VDGDDGGAAWLLCCRILHYLQSWDNGGTLNPLCLTAASDNKATRELVKSSWMATMGYCVAIMLPSIALFAETGQGGHSTHSAWWLLASTEHQRAGGGLVDGDDRGAAWLPCCRIWHFLELGQWGDTQPTLLGGC